MNKKIFEISKYNSSYVYTRTYSAFVADKWGSWSNAGVFGTSSIKKNNLYAYSTGYTASPSLPNPNSSRTINGLRKAKSIHFTFSSARNNYKGWYVRSQPDGYIQLLNGYIFVRCGGNGNYVQVGGNNLLGTSDRASYDLTFYQRYLICNGSRYDYPQDIKLSKATHDNIYASCFAGFITSNDWFQQDYSLSIGDITVEHTV